MPGGFRSHLQARSLSRSFASTRACASCCRAGRLKPSKGKADAELHHVGVVEGAEFLPTRGSAGDETGDVFLSNRAMRGFYRLGSLLGQQVGPVRQREGDGLVPILLTHQSLRRS